jgi:malic enzyme
VAEASLEIKADPANAARYTARGNLVAVVSNGSAVLGLGNIGALASKPVMEGKAVLFKKFANIDCFDLEVDEPTPKNWPKSSARWSRPSARSTSKTSRRRIVSSLNEFAGSG